MALFIRAVSLALSVMTNAEEPKSSNFTLGWVTGLLAKQLGTVGAS
jgi:hypothetical protein